MDCSALEIREVFDGFAYFADNELLSDVRFVFGNNNEDSDTQPAVVRGHKVILAARSPVFHAMFTSDITGNFTDNTNEIKIDDILPEVFRALVKYLCSNELPELSVDLALELLYAARKYLVNRLIEKCECYLSLAMENDVNNILLIGCSAFNECLDPELQAKCHRLQKEKATDILKSPLFLEINEKELTVFLGHDGLPLKELKLFQALLEWGQYHCRKNGLEINATNLRGIMGTSLTQIRFPTMTIEEFTQHVVKENDGLLTKEEAWNVFLAIGGDDKDSKFCTRRRNKPSKTTEKLKNPICPLCKKKTDIFYCDRIRNFCGAPGCTRAGRFYCECCISNISTHSCNNETRYCGQIRQHYCWWCLENMNKYNCRNGRRYCGFLGTTYEL